MLNHKDRTFLNALFDRKNWIIKDKRLWFDHPNSTTTVSYCFFLNNGNLFLPVPFLNCLNSKDFLEIQTYLKVQVQTLNFSFIQQFFFSEKEAKDMLDRFLDRPIFTQEDFPKFIKDKKEKYQFGFQPNFLDNFLLIAAYLVLLIFVISVLF